MSDEHNEFLLAFHYIRESLRFQRPK